MILTSALKPGGWIELQEFCFRIRADDETLKPDDPVANFTSTVAKGLAALGVDLFALEHNRARLSEGGFTRVEEKVLRVPVGVWPRDQNMKTIGLYSRSIIYDGLHAISMGPLTRGLKWTPEEVELWLEGVRKGLMNARVHSWYTFHVAYGQKPLA
jgi:hypothetical protein